MQKMNILAIGAHPDDIEYGCGGTLAKYADRKHRLFLLVLTRGDLGGEPEVRVAEQTRAQEVLGIEAVFWGDYEDTTLQVGKNLISRIEDVIARIKPSFIFCHYPDDTHQDHRHLAQAVISATRYVRNVLFYEGPTTQNFNPQIYVDISDTLARKLQALEAHRSQVNKTNIENLTILELARSTANFRGTQGRVKFAEAFSALRLFINI
jgi:LmbE family N-acetylglucosaminyl deacetylase